MVEDKLVVAWGLGLGRGKEGHVREITQGLHSGCGCDYCLDCGDLCFMGVYMCHDIYYLMHIHYCMSVIPQ